MEENNHQPSENYDPEKDGYNPDRIYDAPPKNSQKHSRSFQENTGYGVSPFKRYPGFIISVVSVILALISAGLTLAAYIFAFSGRMGLIINIGAFLLAVISTSLGFAGGKMNLRQGLPWGKAGAFAVSLSLMALLFSSSGFFFTSCTACIDCSCSIFG